jgi:hypothetical protein
MEIGEVTSIQIGGVGSYLEYLVTPENQQAENVSTLLNIGYGQS